MLDRVPQAAEYVSAQAIARNPNHEQVIWSFVEDQFDRDPRGGAAQHCGERPLPGYALFTRLQTQIVQINLDGAMRCRAFGCQAFHQVGKCSVPFLEARPRRVGIGWTSPPCLGQTTVAICDLYRFHDSSETWSASADIERHEPSCSLPLR
jgi:hypothetical protein